MLPHLLVNRYNVDESVALALGAKRLRSGARLTHVVRGCPDSVC